MSQITARVNLSNKSFPFISEDDGRDVIVRQYDQNYTPSLLNAQTKEDASGIPALYYCHNVMPTQTGYIGVDYKQPINPYSYTEGSFINVVDIKDPSDNEAQFTITSDGRSFVLPKGSTIWISTTAIPGAAGRRFWHANVNGQSYIYVANIGCYKYDFGSNSLIPVTLSGLAVGTIIGILAAQGYLIAWSTTAVAWSSTIDPTDFVPSLVTGAGGGQLQDAKGQIVACYPVISGFIAFTTSNAVGARYSGNSRYPFIFTECFGCGGLVAPDYVAFDPNLYSLYAYTTYGLQVVTLQQAQNIYPEVTDYFNDGYFEDFDESALTFSQTRISTAIPKRLATIGARYIVISYGYSSLSYCLVYDTVLQRWGKLKIDHAVCFTYGSVFSSTLEIPANTFAFLKVDGSIWTVDMDHGTDSAQGIALFGKYQFVRQRGIQLDSVIIDGVKDTAVFDLFDLATLDGKTYQPAVAGYLAVKGFRTRTYNFRTFGINHTLVMKGAFDLSSLVLQFNIGGRR